MDRFRAIFIVLFLWLAVLRTYFRILGRGTARIRVPEFWTIAAVVLLGLPFMFGVWLYIFHPQPLKPMNFSLAPAWRWAGAVIFAVSLVLLTWIHVMLGKNFSATLRIRLDQELVTQGPYRYVRHPMYSAIFLMIIGMGLLSANWMILLGGPGFVIPIVIVRTPMEEEMLVRAFGERYCQYTATTGRFLPRLRNRSTRGIAS